MLNQNNLISQNANVPTTNSSSIEQSRAIMEVQGAIMMAKKFPRDEQLALSKILNSCAQPALAEVAQYAYPRGGQMVEGASINLAKEMARHWGNIQFDIVELSQDNDKGVSEIMAYAWDMETNHRACRTFNVTHERYTRNNGRKRLVDPRDIYEHTANFGSRRLRACILDLLPDWAIQSAVETCNNTLLKNNEGSLEENLQKMIQAFSEFNITQQHIEKRLGHNFDVTTAGELAQLRKIYRSLRDGMTKPSDVFDVSSTKSIQHDKVSEINSLIEDEEVVTNEDKETHKKK